MFIMKNAVIINSPLDVENTTVFTENIVERFIKFAGVTTKSANTYIVALRQMFKYFNNNDIINPSRSDLENWRDFLIDSGKSASTIQLYLTSAKLFFRWLALEGIYKNVADNLKSRVRISHEHKKDALSAKQSKELLKSAKGNHSLKDKRNTAIIALMLTAGLRTIEICRADVKDIRTINGATFLFVQGKGRSEKAESVRISPKVYSMIQSYLKERGKVKGDEPLFVSTSNRCKNQRLDTQTIRKMIKFNLRKIGLDNSRLTAHSLRHTAATVMILAGVELAKVQMVLRHKNINTTMIYNNAVERLKNTAELSATKAIFGAG